MGKVHQLSIFCSQCLHLRRLFPLHLYVSGGGGGGGDGDGDGDSGSRSSNFGCSMVVVVVVVVVGRPFSSPRGGAPALKNERDQVYPK
jgi:hypothetical protein